jgi:hypothetical protein
MLGFELELEWQDRDGYYDCQDSCDDGWDGEESVEQSDYWTRAQLAAAAAAENCWASDWTYDCSLHWGLELRSRPRSWADWVTAQPEVADWFARHCGEFEADTTCGLHVHVTRTDFTDAAHVRRLFGLVFAEAEVPRWRALSGRGEYSNFGALRAAHDATKLDDCVTSFLEGRYYYGLPGNALRLNFKRVATLEFRLWSGADTVDGLYARLGATHALVEFTRDPEAVLTAEAWAQWVQAREEYAALHAWMERSGFNALLEVPHVVHAGV